MTARVPDHDANLRCSKRGFDFRGVVAIVVDNEHASDFPLTLETPAGAAKTSQCSGDLGKRTSGRHFAIQGADGS